MKSNKKNKKNRRVISGREKEIFGIVLIVISLSMITSLVISDPLHTNPNHLLGIIGNGMSNIPYLYFGYCSIALPIILLIVGYIIFTKRVFNLYLPIIFKISAITFWVASFFGFLYNISDNMNSSLALIFHTGIIGDSIYAFFNYILGPIGYPIFLSITLILLVTWLFDISNYDLGLKIYNQIKFKALLIKQRVFNKKHINKKAFDHSNIEDDLIINNIEITSNNESENISTKTEEKENQDDIENLEINENNNEVDINESVVIEDEAKVIEGDIDSDSNRKNEYFNYKLPSIDNLASPIEIQSHNEEELKRKAEEIVYAINSFGVSCEVVKISPGPVITLYEIEPAEGVRVNKITNLSEDLSRIMGGKRVRVLDNIPGTRSVGIELPNDKPSIVYLKSIINSQMFIDSKSKLNIALGKTTTGDAFVFDLNKMPHLLVAGATGAGKSVCINTIIVSILYNAKPDEVKFILMDPKKVELSTYKSLVGYHLVTAKNIDEYVMTTAENSVSILESAINEMEKRFQLFSEVRVRNIQEYHQKQKDNKDLETVPYVVVIIDELADLMMTSSRSIEEPITRLAQKARAVGIHLIVATQRPSVDVITGLIKSNFPARISFQVSSKIDSRTIIDQMGAEKLLGRGDMLFLLPGTAAPIRLHNALVTLDEIEKIMDHITKQPKPEELKLPEIKKNTKENEFIINENQDELLHDAAKLVVDYQQASVSLLQRKFRIGYSRAGRLIDELESLGIVSEYNGSKAREVLFTHNQLTDLFSD